MTPTQTRIHHADNERMLLGRHLANAAPNARAGAVGATADELDWILPTVGMVVLTLAMVSAVLFVA